MSSLPGDRPTIDLWESRAPAYAALVRRWTIFTTLAQRLVDSLPADFDGALLDLAAGSGLCSERVLMRHPLAQLHLADPAPAMLTEARARLADQRARSAPTGAQAHSYHELAGEEIGQLAAGQLGTGQLDACVCSAAAHLFDEDLAFPALAQLLRPGGVYAFNFWGHAFAETAQHERFEVRRILDASCMALGFEAPTWREQPAPRVRSRADIDSLAHACGMRLEACVISADPLAEAFYVDFACMDPYWLEGIPSEHHAQIIADARARCQGEESAYSVRFLLRRM